MLATRRALCFVYALIAVAALLLTWQQNLHYFADFTPARVLAGLGVFMLDTKVTAASRSITLDLMATLLAVNVWMVSEARRLAMRGVWVYVVLEFMIAISVTLPLFMLARELRLTAGAQRERPSPLLVSDWIGLAAVAAVTARICAYVSG